MKNQLFDFHGSEFTIKVLTSESNDRYTVLDILHAPNIGPAEHHHHAGPETFHIVEGDYEEVNEDGNGKQSGTPTSKGKETETGDSVRGSKREDKKDGETTTNIENGRTSKTTGEVRKAT